MEAKTEAAGGQVGTQLLFENERVRVWDFALEPGEALEAHVHHTDYVYIVVSGGLMRVDDPNAPGGSREVQFRDGDVAFVPVEPEGKYDPRHTNIGDKPHRNYVVELKSPAS